MYHKILDEALAELRETDFKDILAEEPVKEFVKECQIETDLEILIPDTYVNNVKERIALYKELDNIENETVLLEFRTRLIDRFGQLPKQSEELIDTIRLRWLAKEIGFEKIVLKGGKMIGNFIANAQSDYFMSDQFTKVLEFIKKHPKDCVMKEVNQKLNLTIFQVRQISEAISKLNMILAKKCP
jgi:transcription-repair coupling factor (superfamily II helicase)